jgi:hypothetical protein
MFLESIQSQTSERLVKDETLSDGGDPGPNTVLTSLDPLPLSRCASTIF